MQDYQHGRYAGNFADVVKHVVVVALLSSLRSRAHPFYVYDTHAGRGIYALDALPAGKKNDYRQGIARLWDACPGAPGSQSAGGVPPVIEPYLQIIAQHNPDGQLRTYPGSPALIQHMLRDEDQLCLTELDGDAATHLQALYQRDGRVKISQRDAFAVLQAFSPPPMRQGLVLIDPPYVQDTEYRQVADSVGAAYRRWPGGTYAIWYPLKSEEKQQAFLQACAAAGISEMLHLQFRLDKTHYSPEQFTGCGVLLVNPPLGFDRQMAVVLDYLAERIKPDGSAFTAVDWLDFRTDADNSLQSANEKL